MLVSAIPFIPLVLALHHLPMCVLRGTKMGSNNNDDDDGGLGHVLRTAERVMSDLSSPVGGDGSSRSMSSSSSGGGGGVIGGGGKRMDLSRYTSDELRSAMMPMVSALECLDAASVLSLTPVRAACANTGKDGREGGGGGGGGGTMAVLDPGRGLSVPPIHDLIVPPHRRPRDGCGGDGSGGGAGGGDDIGDDVGGGGGSVVRYLHVEDVPNAYSAGIFVFPPNARMPLHDHPNMVVLTRVLYGELEVISYDVVDDRLSPLPPDNDDRRGDDDVDGDVRDRMDVDDEDDDRYEATGRGRSRSFLSDSLNRIREYVLNRVLSSFLNNDDGGCDGEGMHRVGTFDDRVLRARPNMNPMGAMRRDGEKDGHDDDGGDGDNRRKPTFVITAPSVTCLYPREGNCHSFVAGPHGAAVLDVLFPPYGDDGDDDDGVCTYYETRESGGAEYDDDDDGAAAEEDDERRRRRRPPLVLLSPIDQPDDFNCVRGSYGRFGSRR